MSRMFYNCTSLKELELSKFDTSNVIDMNEIFYGCESLRELNLSNFKTHNMPNYYRLYNDRLRLIFKFCYKLEVICSDSRIIHQVKYYGHKAKII